MARWRTENCAALCCGSIFHSVAAAKAETELSSTNAAMPAMEAILVKGYFTSVLLLVGLDLL
jgi:hypothetical protein